MAARQPAPSIWLRPERAEVGRPAQRSRAQITAAALGIADTEGLAAVSMRRIAAQLGTGPASLYRYVGTREELLDLMTDAVGGEYALPGPSGDWLADLLAISDQSRAIVHRHRWLPDLMTSRPVLGPNGVRLLEHVLAVLAAHPADIATKLEAFAVLNGVTALLIQHELADGSPLQQRNAAYLHHAATSGEWPRLTRLLSQDPAPPDPTAGADPALRDRRILARILTGLLGPAPGSG
jgi:AcrR family transcriptional regulator